MQTIPAAAMRIIDAAANRTGEGLRVVEEFVRFALNDAHLSKLMKECRHDFAQAISTLSESDRLSARDTVGDVGAAIGTTDEYERESLEDVARASLKRIQESLRTIEEYGKLLGSTSQSDEFRSLAPRIEQLRYRTYTLEKAVLRVVNSRQRLANHSVYLLLTTGLCRDSMESTLLSALRGGVRMIQVREKSLPDRELIEHVRRVRILTSAANALLIINDRPDIAALANADGVHVGQDELSVSDARRIVGPGRLVGVSTHTIEQARQAVLDGADYLGVGPTFASQTKSFEEYAGLAFIRQVASEISLPWYAIGGIHLENVDQVLQAGAKRVAISHAICASQDPHQTAAELVAKVGG